MPTPGADPVTLGHGGLKGADVSTGELDRRSGTERRQKTMAAYWHGGLHPRRRSGRRASDSHYPIIDWYPPRLLAPALAILGLCVLDGLLTVLLMTHGAVELNPVMAAFLPHDLGWFAAIKLALTSMGLFILVACSHMRLFRTIPGEVLVYLVLVGYACLIAYELKLLELAPLDFSG
jgi:hypothetical protein